MFLVTAISHHYSCYYRVVLAAVAEAYNTGSLSKVSYTAPLPYCAFEHPANFYFKMCDG